MLLRESFGRKMFVIKTPVPDNLGLTGTGIKSFIYLKRVNLIVFAMPSETIRRK